MRQGIIFLLLTSIILLIGCENFSEVKKNQLMIDQIRKEENVSKDSLMKNFTEEEIKEKALKAVKEYYDRQINESDFFYKMSHITPERMKNRLEQMEIDKYLQIKMDYKDILKNGYYSMYYYKAQNGYYSMYTVEIDAETGEILKIEHFEIDEKKEKTNEKISLEQAKKIGEDFIKKKKFFKNDRMKLVKAFNGREQGIARMKYFLYEDSEEASNKLLIGVRENTKRVESLSRGVKALIDMNMERYE